MNYNPTLNETLAAWNPPKGVRKGGNVGGNGTLLPAPELIRCTIMGRTDSPNTSSTEDRVHPDTIGAVSEPNASRSSDSVWTTADSTEEDSEAGEKERYKERTYKPESESSEENDTDYEHRSQRSKHKKNYRQKETKHVEDITIATINIRGKIQEKGTTGKKNKIAIIIDEMRLRRIDIVALQETHTKEEETEQLQKRYPDLDFALSGEESNKEGIMLIVKKDAARINKEKTTNIIKGRLMETEIETKHKQKIRIIVIYAPNEQKKKDEFYKKEIRQKEGENIIMLGDFNMCEENMDRYPNSKADTKKIREIWKKTKRALKLQDGWRTENPDTLDFTFYQKDNRDKKNIMARIDRIYNSENLERQMGKHKIIGKICSDHAMITSTIHPPRDYKIEKNRWRIKEYTMKEGTFTKEYIKEATKLEEKIKKYKDNEKRIKRNKATKEEKDKRITSLREQGNPQTAWKEYKENIRTIAQRLEKVRRKNLEKEEKEIKDQIKTITEKRIWNEKDQKDLTELREKQMKAIQRHHKAINEAKKVNWKALGEKCSKYYFNLRKPQRQENIIERLKDKRKQVKEDPKEMAEIASEYHRELQKTQPMTERRERAIEEILSKIQVEVKEKHKDTLTENIKLDNLLSALKKCKNGKSPGEDGLTYEFWKWTHKIAEELKKEENKEKAISPVKAMKEYLVDTENYGPIDGDFAKGLLFPLYKKGDTEEIANYRPITLLNTDYKLYTRTVGEKITRASQKIIHKDQAGFMPGRSIYDHTRLINIIEEACEIEEVNGYIIALDQEKAYDKIDHNYLWRTMTKFKVPEETTKRIRKIYESERTQVIVNGHKGSSFPVSRGTRQGDPMSCILYNIAIEPMAIALRESDLKGLKLSDDAERVLTTMYADDTALTLHEDDDREKAKELIDLFCIASTARFNEHKEEIMAVGKKEFQEDFQKNRRMRCGHKVPEHVKVITKDNPMRMLGAWHGNKGEVMDQWNRILEKQEDIMEMWATSRPTLKARVLLAKALVQSRAIYLAMVNGMPKSIEKRMTKQIENFFWKGRKPQVRWDILCKPIKEGGVNAPSIRIRNEAIDIMWAKSLFSAHRPRWAQIGHYLLKKHSRNQNKDAIYSWPIQRMDIEIQKLPKIIRKIITIARRTNLGISPVLPTETLRDKMPALFHIGANKNMFRKTDCLVKRHKIKTIKDLENLSTKPQEVIRRDKDKQGVRCKEPKRCIERAKRIIKKALPDKWKPGKSRQEDDLDHTPKRIKKFKKASHRKEEITYNPEIKSKDTPWEEIRIFRKGEAQTWPTRNKTGNGIRKMIGPCPPPETPRKNQGIRDIRIYAHDYPKAIYTDGAALRNGAANAEVGLGVWIENNPEKNRKLRLKVENADNQKAELAAIIIALQENRRNSIKIYSDSETAILGILRLSRAWEDLGWHRTENAEYYRSIISELRQRTKPCALKWVKGHSGIKGNEEADKLAEQGIGEEAEFTKENLRINEDFMEDGAKLNKITMRIAYEMILDRETTEDTENRKRYIEDIINKIEYETTYRPTKELLYKATWKANIPNNIIEFIWKAQRQLLKCGKMFLKWGGDWHDRAYCQCGEVETPEHIIMECHIGEQTIIWKETKEILKKIENKEWKIEWHNILGAGCLPATIYLGSKEEKKREQQRTRAYTSIILNAAWLIWKFRSKRVIEKEETQDEEMKRILREEILEQCQIESKVIGKINNKKRRIAEEKKFAKTWIKTGILRENKYEELTWA